MTEEHTYIVVYDISESGRLRTTFKLLHGFGEWVQLSVFQCRLTRGKVLELRDRLTQTIDLTEDHVMIIDVGPAETVLPKVISLGKRGFKGIERVPVIV